ncbi:MAG: copper homeostasis protein CutC, partial [Bacteroidaceae bacterium]|nr:copper homeostasis protein CutC [Bacteroidaceae bacterium]
MIVEVCCNDIESVAAAIQGGAQRVELCRELSLDGLTPSLDTMEEAVRTGICVHVLIRPRPGNFIYTEEEIQRM